MPRRSRACEACKKRRIGCDLGQPSCNNCLRVGRICSGPIDGPLIVNQTNSVVSRSRRIQTSDNLGTCGPVLSKADLPRQPSSRAVESVAFTGQFFSFISDQSQKPSKESWIVQAHTKGVGQDSAASALFLSIQATSLAHCGAVTKHHPATREACRMYGVALQRLFKALSLGRYESSASSPSSSSTAKSLEQVAIVCTAVILSIFEAIHPTTTTAYAMHLAAAWRILGLMQKDNMLGVPVIDQAAIHLQFQTLFVMVAYPTQYMTSAPEARRWNALGRSRYHQTADISTRFMIDLFDLADFFATRNGKPDYDGLIKSDPGIKERINGLWEEYNEEARSAGVCLQWTLENDEQCYRDAYTAFVIAYFSTARLLLAVIRMDVESNITEPCEDILRCSAFLATRNIGCACLRMFFPLTLVARYSTSPRQRGAAFRYLSGWLQDATFTGLSIVAIRSVNPNSTTKEDSLIV
ncbi:unnamed protein product [Clonostachys rosea]|uniref:Zn(2)-C6 fungal-type domain-containing protein n=1 Tax=Bionectria ochroleuca TaxID=29856 RepID=A0ABY6TZZ6_BIOOC|nr:unnamed protein product [Clonostachys rosea]